MAVSVVFRGDVALITLDDGRVNALNPTSLSELESALNQAEAAGALVIAGRAGTFCGGLDLKYLPFVSPEERARAIDQFTTMMMRVFCFPRPVFAAVTGHALGGGAILALAADVRVFAPGTSRFSLVEVPLGVPLPGFAMQFAGQAVHGSVLAEMCMFGRVFSPEDALRCGLSATNVEDAVEEACRRAEAVAKLPREAFVSTKRRMRETAVGAAEAAIAKEGLDFLAAFESMLAKAKR